MSIMHQAAKSHPTHDCGGTVLTGGTGDMEHQYCDRCGAYTHDVEADRLPTGTDPAANRAAFDDGDYQSPDGESALTSYQIAWGHSGNRGREWSTAREASRYAAEEWGTVEAESAEAAVEQVRSKGVEVEDWHQDGNTIHVI